LIEPVFNAYEEQFGDGGNDADTSNREAAQESGDAIPSEPTPALPEETREHKQDSSNRRKSLGLILDLIRFLISLSVSVVFCFVFFFKKKKKKKADLFSQPAGSALPVMPLRILLLHHLLPHLQPVRIFISLKVRDAFSRIFFKGRRKKDIEREALEKLAKLDSNIRITRHAARNVL
jgi:hypothetical protein